MSIKLALVEDDAELRRLYAEYLARVPGFAVVGAYASAEAAMDAMPELHPDVALVDINLPQRSGIECVAALKAKLPRTQFLMVTVYEDADRVFEALAAGATGYLLKDTPKAELTAAIRDVMDGGSPMSGHIARKVVSSFRRPVGPVAEEGKLSPREQEILQLLAGGYAYKEIVDRLQISRGSLNTYIRRIYEKLHVRSRGEAVARLMGRSPASPAP